MVGYSIRNVLPLDYILVQMNSVHFLTFFYDEVLLDPTILSSFTPSSPRGLLPSGYSLRIPHISQTCIIYCPSLQWYDNSNIW